MPLLSPSSVFLCNFAPSLSLSLSRFVRSPSLSRFHAWVLARRAPRASVMADITHLPMEQLQDLEYCIDSNPPWGRHPPSSCVSDKHGLVVLLGSRMNSFAFHVKGHASLSISVFFFFFLKVMFCLHVGPVLVTGKWGGLPWRSLSLKSRFNSVQKWHYDHNVGWIMSITDITNLCFWLANCASLKPAFISILVRAFVRKY